jgi:Dyp-type peroxidase family
VTASYDPDVQGLVYSGYRRSYEATYLLLAVADPQSGRAWARALVPRLRWGGEKGNASNLNVAFTATGLRRLGATEKELASFDPAFCEGIHSDRRALILDDRDAAAPTRWVWGGPGAPAEIALLVFSGDAQSHRADVARELQDAARFGLQHVHSLPAATLPQDDDDLREHFGFADGISQPLLADTPDETDPEVTPAARALHMIPKGEIVLGYPNVYGEVTSVPSLVNAPHFGVNGSYLVLRQLQQDVAGFWKYFLDAAGRDLDVADRLAAKSVGRWRNGAPLAQYPLPPPTFSRAATENDFSYRDSDPDGDRCPLGSHIRRGNPRDSQPGNRDDVVRHVKSHRILRRGRAYGPRIADPRRFQPDGLERGLLFACLNANIARQFEFVQHSWLGNPSFHGLHEEGDPLMAADADPRRRFTIQAKPLRERLSAIPRFVNAVGGGYFFLPGRAGLLSL